MRRAAGNERGTARHAITSLAAMLVIVTVAGCGGTQSPRVVHLALTAPTSGSVVTVGNIRVFGTVEPRGAAVVVAGKRAHVADGQFARSMVLHAGLSHITVRATAAGYAPAKLDVAIRRLPGPHKEASNTGLNAGTPPSTPHPYDPQVKATLIRTCEAGAAGAAAGPTVCRCVLAHLEAHVSMHTLADWERAFLKGEATLPRWLRDAALACRQT